MSYKFLRQPPPPAQPNIQNAPQNTTPTPPPEDKIALLKAKLKQNKATGDKPAETTTPSIPTAQTTVLVFYLRQYWFQKTPAESVPDKSPLKADLMALKLAALSKYGHQYAQFLQLQSIFVIAAI